MIKEESREEKLSKKAAAKEKELAELAKRRAALEELVKQQSDHIEKNKPLAGQEALSDAEKQTASKLGEAQEATRKATKALADEPVPGGGKSQNLGEAAGSMQSAVDSLAKARRGRSAAADGEGARKLEERAGRDRQARSRSQGGPGQGKPGRA